MAAAAVSWTGFGASDRAAAATSSPASLVNPFIGTTNGADDFPGADAPFGMIQFSPDTSPDKPAGGGYEYNDSAISGFSLFHLSGPGCGAGGDVPILPTVGAVDGSATDSFSHGNESARPGYYQVALGNGVTTKLTATTRTGMAEFDFPSTTQANLQFNLSQSQNGTSNQQFSVVSNTEVSGQVSDGDFCGRTNQYTLYFDIQFNVPMTGSGTFSGGDYVTFDTSGNQTVLAKVGVSYVSVANARLNLSTENPNWNLAAIQQATFDAWNGVLDRIQVTGGTSAQQAVFYTALYHALLHPNVLSDVNGQYPGFDGTTHTVDSGHSAVYGNYSGWDIYRSQAQLEALVDPSVASDTAQSMLDDYQQTGLFPKWSENNGESYMMVGDPADAIIADYYAFGARDFDTSTTLTDLLAQANSTSNGDRPGNNYQVGTGYNSGYLPADGSYGCCYFYGPTSTQLEYDTADAALSSFAGALGDTADQSALIDRAQNWMNVVDPASAMMEPRNANGDWISGFDPTNGTDFVEASSYIYTDMVPFNLAGLIADRGGDAPVNSYLNLMLAGLHGGGSNADLSNEPSLYIPWMYDYTGEPYLAQQVVREVQDQIWTDTPGGLAGNDDLGTMSAWYVWSALGMYPETPGTADLALGSPMFTTATVALPSGNTLTIDGNGAADNAPYVQSASWNGTSWNNAFAPTDAITSGGTLSYTLGTSANTGWASQPNAAPPSYAGDAPTFPTPATGAVTSGVAAAAPGLCIDDSARGTANGTVIQAYTCNNTPAQEVTSLGDSLHVMGKCVDDPDSSITAGTKVQLYDCNGTDAQVWIPRGNGELYNPNANMCLDDPGAAGSGTQLEIQPCSDAAEQQWTLPAGGAPRGEILDAANNLCLDDSSSNVNVGNVVQIWGCDTTNAQDWSLNNDTLQVLGRCADVTGNGTAISTKIQLNTCDGSPGEVFQPQSNGALLNPNSGMCLDDPGQSTTQGTQLQIYTCNNSPAQVWTLP